MRGLDASPLSPGLARYLRLLGWIDRASFGAIVAAMGLMTLLVSVQVFMRYVMSSSIDSAAELSRLFFVWSIFLALPHGIRRGVHVSVDALTAKLPDNLRRWTWRLTTSASLLLMAALAWLSLGAVADKWQQMMPTIEITASVFYIAILISAVHSGLHLIALLWLDQGGQESRNDDSRLDTEGLPS